MTENSAISWTQHTWNPWIGCTKLTPACDGCYAEAMMDKRFNKVQWGNHPRLRTSAANWKEPLRWNRQAEKDGTRPFVFCASLADIFDNQVDPAWRADAFEVMRKTPLLVYLLLTKRPQNIVKLSDAAGGLPPNAAIGTTVEDQKRSDTNLPALDVARIELQPLFTFGSFEPLLEYITVPRIFMPGWIIAGGETDQGDHKARPTHPEWIKHLRDQAHDAGIPFHLKQWGEWKPVSQMSDAECDALYVPAPPSHPDARRRCKVDTMVLHADGNQFSILDKGAFASGQHAMMMMKVGRSKSGRILDGKEHNAFPQFATALHGQCKASAIVQGLNLAVPLKEANGSPNQTAEGVPSWRS